MSRFNLLRKFSLLIVFLRNYALNKAGINFGLLDAVQDHPKSRRSRPSGALYAPVPLAKLPLGPGERADVLIDFSGFADQTLILQNNARSPFPKGDVVDPLTTGQIMAFRVRSSAQVQNQIPNTLLESPIAPLVQTGATRKLLLFEGEDEYGRLQPSLGTADDGAMMWDEPTTELPQLNDVELWEIFNSTEDAHPIHLHLVSFQVLSRQKFNADPP